MKLAAITLVIALLLQAPYLIQRFSSSLQSYQFKKTLQGAWSFDSYEFRLYTPSGEIDQVFHSQDRNITGLLLYTTDGYMVAQLAGLGDVIIDESFDQLQCQSRSGSSASIFSYYGKYHLNHTYTHTSGIVNHIIDASTSPSFAGVQGRVANFSNDYLTLSPMEELVHRGMPVKVDLTWKKIT
ncbi:hypothetical protein BDV25DRAFT_137057 [Aspergillus avenaceus]|uniref:Lipocalin-like domain-containing protein n=1 Tax=Aspergillus avenaceus TaxID=36643 RepID=A0A5N6U510_ASPAV|nr:hypothetical protein BDV25DRAFT_137057 [Aspergillus avenaceus]